MVEAKRHKSRLVLSTQQSSSISIWMPILTVHLTTVLAGEISPGWCPLSMATSIIFKDNLLKGTNVRNYDSKLGSLPMHITYIQPSDRRITARILSSKHKQGLSFTVELCTGSATALIRENLNKSCK